ncbi:SH3 domain-containing protein [Rubellimicrobium arenae]|uniref:SH3 domain-containing protein n=1 Tax=Rubellimicrobium arenae TaxID=2817372 RepID=UPI001B3144E0
MRIFILLSFALMALAYWALSGGSDFRPETRAEATTAPAPETAAEAEPSPAGPALDTPEEASGTRMADAGGPADIQLDEVTGVTALAAETPSEAEVEPGPDPDAALGPVEALAAIAPELTTPREEVVDVASADAAGALRRVTGDRVNVRLGPGVEFDVVGQVDAGDMAEVVDRDGGWVRVRMPSGELGWMSARFLADAEG